MLTLPADRPSEDKANYQLKVSMRRLLNTRSLQLELFLHRDPPPYAIVSHRWGPVSEEVIFEDIGDQASARKKAKGFAKIQGSCAQALQQEIKYIWLDTCCIDKSNSTELIEAINAMYKWYQQSKVCYVYLHDVSDPSKFTKSDWFTRGWTLQELIAPQSLCFFTKDWRFIGTREDLIDPIANVTGISPEILRCAKIPRDVTISQKMFWAAKRETTVMEDRAYSLLGILGIHMVPTYGIDHAAFQQLQRDLVTRFPDQSLFAWYHTVTPLEDVEMADAPLESGPVPSSSIESVDNNSSPPFKLMNNTGLLASSPSQYLKSYEISESDFRKHYVDVIGDDSYNSHFSITNNVVRINLPMKHMKEKIWKAVLRCSFDPPGRNQIQRPLIIYLQAIEPWKYTRVHFIADEEGEAQKNDVEGVAGSLEQLNDEDLNLQGYALRNIDVVCQHGEHLSNDQPKQSTSDPEPTEAERISRLPRHPPGVKPTNIIVCGEPGVSVGRAINLIVGGVVIKPLTDYECEPMAVTVIDTTLQSKHIRIFYIIGPRDSYIDLDTYYTAVRHMYRLVQLATEGIHLVLLCMAGSSVTGTVKSNYRLFCKHICNGQVPKMLIVTGLGKTKRMEDWWDKHKTDADIRAMSFSNHACITVLQGEDEEHERKYTESVEAIQQLLVDFVKTTPKAYRPPDQNQWFASMGRGAMDLLLFSQKKALKQEVLAKNLKEGLDLNEAEVDDLARRFFDEHTME